MQLTSVTYTSLARADLPQAELETIQELSRAQNRAADITGLLVFNGTHFLQVVEGPERAIQGLIDRLRQDPRHSGFEIRDQRKVVSRSFPDWQMELIQVAPSLFEAREAIVDCLPDTVSDVIHMRLLRMTELISTISFQN
ncbi:BLUF domain-containing protein [Sphingomonas daechungensis]|uniref:BLUF domain-containing protein n=1 Tax=Sphingomonas daechungensis TaxID=1176646 RepID=UPI0037843DA0